MSKSLSPSPLAAARWLLADYGHRLQSLATRLASARLDHSLCPAFERAPCTCPNARSAAIGETGSEPLANVAWSGLLRQTNRETVAGYEWD